MQHFSAPDLTGDAAGVTRAGSGIGHVSGVSVLDQRVPMRDGARLAADVVLPQDAGPLPVLLIRSPYSRGAMRLVHDVVGLARGGWAVVVQDVRGRFDSAGSFTPFACEIEDGYDSVDWCTRQPWSDGRVAMTGWSYVGATQWLAALGGHPALKAINPVIGAGDIADAMTTEGGAFLIGLVQPWVLGLAASDPTLSQSERERAGQLGASWADVVRLPPAHDPVAELVPSYAAWRRGERPAGPTITGCYDQLGVAAFQIAGWYDVFCESALRHHAAMTLGEGRPPQRLVVGPWSHSNGFSNVHPEMDFGGAANGGYAGIHATAVHWLRKVLDGESVPRGISLFVMGEGWREVDSWPPPATTLALHLSSGPGSARSSAGDGALRPEPGPAGADVFHHDPQDPVPTRGGRVLGPFLPLPGPVDQRPLEQREDVLVFSGAPLEQPLTVVGPVLARLRVASSGRSMDVAVKLCDVEPGGRSINIVDSVRRVDVEPGVPVDVEVDVGSTAWRFAPGHRIRLHISGSNFPRFDVNPATGEAAGRATRLEPADHRVHWGDAVSVVILPVTA